MLLPPPNLLSQTDLEKKNFQLIVFIANTDLRRPREQKLPGLTAVFIKSYTPLLLAGNYVQLAKHRRCIMSKTGDTRVIEWAKKKSAESNS